MKEVFSHDYGSEAEGKEGNVYQNDFGLYEVYFLPEYDAVEKY